MSDLSTVGNLNGRLSTGNDISGTVTTDETLSSQINQEDELSANLATESNLDDAELTNTGELAAALNEDEIEAVLTGDATLGGNVSDSYILGAELQPGTGTGGETFDLDYTKLINKPRIEGVTLVGNKMFPELNLKPVTNTELEEIFSF